MDQSEVMRSALKLAGKGLSTTSPNPAVGAIVVKAGRLVAKGWHKKAGEAHAEVMALEEAGPKARGATLYVTLEPCCHHGRTPPCVDAVIRAGIKKVVIGATDPNPRVSGKGVKALRAAGIEVVTNVLEGECTHLNEAYNRYITAKKPFVTLKLAATLDGRIATSTGESRWITGPEARKLVHRLRSRADVVLVGSSTVIQDDPALTVRHVRGPDPGRVVLDSTFRTPLGSKVFEGPAKTKRGVYVFTTSKAPKEKLKEASALGVEAVVVRATKGGVDIGEVLSELARKEVTSVLVEGGARLSAALLRAGLVDKVLYFISPTLLGSDGVPSVGPLGVERLKDAQALKRVSARKAGPDILIEGYF